ncbi:Minf_1886 family protein [Paludisphaera borealis]|uniref:Uncharacterized protein n=1 Tax=Paludisphaera borealis TaxID=1387353 RepID=A0A1U7CXG1_9BACT|nr:Minf_1886 family protein [Paludisphaera borealis]APW63573.1 hypothetical protein BSF38_05146 [Paludisphaera borealis]
MSFRDEIGRVIAKDPRYSLEAYAFVLESLHLARSRKLRDARRAERARGPRPRRGRPTVKGKSEPSGHVTGKQVCHAARRLAIRQFGLLAVPVLEQWGLCSTSDIGEIVFNLIASGDLDKTPDDRRSDFDDVYDFATALGPKPAVGEKSPSETETEDV